MQAILLYLTHGDNPSKLLNHFIPLVTHLLLPLPIDLDVWTENLALKSRNGLVGVIRVTLPRYP